ncbi:hypothetical protein DL93DRAFT_2174475 [Clavulina sp. PMI_390]|nr:hypothetical protein DL93DRAFT_2174475 [Clavulina sp. PMI_390]
MPSSKKKLKHNHRNTSSRPLTEQDAQRRAKDDITKLLCASRAFDNSQLEALSVDHLWWIFIQRFMHINDPARVKSEDEIFDTFISQLSSWFELGLFGMLAQLVIEFADIAIQQLDLATNVLLAEPSLLDSLTWICATDTIGHLFSAILNHTSSFSSGGLSRVEDDACRYGTQLLRSFQKVYVLYASERCIGALDVTTVNIAFTIEGMAIMLKYVDVERPSPEFRSTRVPLGYSIKSGSTASDHIHII